MLTRTLAAGEAAAAQLPRGPKGEMHTAFAKAVGLASKGKDDPLSFMLKLAAGRF